MQDHLLYTIIKERVGPNFVAVKVLELKCLRNAIPTNLEDGFRVDTGMVFESFFSPPDGVQLHQIGSWRLQFLIARSLLDILGCCGDQRLSPFDKIGEHF